MCQSLSTWQPACKSSNHAHCIYLFRTVRGTLLIPICYVSLTSPSGSPPLHLGFPNSLHAFLVHDLSIPFKGSATKILTKHIATKSTTFHRKKKIQPLIFTKNNSSLHLYSYTANILFFFLKRKITTQSFIYTRGNIKFILKCFFKKF